MKKLGLTIFPRKARKKSTKIETCFLEKLAIYLLSYKNRELVKQAERKVKLSTFEPDLGNANVGNEDDKSRTYGKLQNQ